MPSVEQINAFVEVYEAQSYSVAARRLNKARTTVRELVITLEDQMNLTLFTTQGKKLVASQDACKLYFYAKLLHQQLMMFEDLALTAHQKQEEQITLCYDPMLPNDFMVEMTSLLQQKFPHVHLHWQLRTWLEAVELMTANVTHVSFFPVRKNSVPDLQVQVSMLGSQKFYIYCGVNNELTKLSRVTQLHLRNTTQILPENILNSDLKEYVRFATKYIAVQSNDDVCRLVERIGWALLPESQALPYVEQGKIIRLQPDFLLNALQISMSSFYSPALSYLLELLPSLAKKYFV